MKSVGRALNRVIGQAWVDERGRMMKLGIIIQVYSRAGGSGEFPRRRYLAKYVLEFGCSVGR